MRLIRDGRDLRVDVFRGVALWWIFTDHVPGDFLGDLSLRNFALCDATEVFVLLAGYAAGIAYGRTMARHGWLYAAADVIRRAWTLYIAHIFLFVVFAAQVAYSAQALDRAEYLDEIHLDALGDAPYQALLQALTLSFQPAYLNILPMYIVLLLLFAAALPLLRWPSVLGVASLALYAAARLVPLAPPSWTGGTWFFNPMAWQLLFMLGAILSHAPGKPPSRPRVLDALAGLVVAFGVFVQWVVWPIPGFSEHLPAPLAAVVMSVDKDGLHPFRLVSILALAWLAVRLVPASARWLRSRWAAPFVLMGQHSLPVFCGGIALSFLGRLAMEYDDGPPMQVAVNGAGFAAMVAIGALCAWYRAKGAEPGSRKNHSIADLPTLQGADTA
jgi:hypothetical protein